MDTQKVGCRIWDEYQQNNSKMQSNSFRTRMESFVRWMGEGGYVNFTCRCNLPGRGGEMYCLKRNVHQREQSL